MAAWAVSPAIPVAQKWVERLRVLTCMGSPSANTRHLLVRPKGEQVQHTTLWIWILAYGPLMLKNRSRADSAGCFLAWQASEFRRIIFDLAFPSLGSGGA